MSSRTPAPEHDAPELRLVYEEIERPSGTVAEISDPDEEDAWIRSDVTQPIVH